MTIRNESFLRFNGDLSEVIVEINVDTADELPEVDEIPGRILHQGSTALIIKESRVAVLSGDGHWYINGEAVK